MSANRRLREVIAEQLEAHELMWIGAVEGYACGCDEHGDLPEMPTLREAINHQADVVLAAITKAGLLEWGYRSGLHGMEVPCRDEAQARAVCSPARGHVLVRRPVGAWEEAR